MSNEIADLDAWRLPDHLIPTRRVPTVKERKRRGYWVQFPEAWVKRLAEVQAGVSAYRLALYLLRRKQITKNRTFTVPNGALRNEGVSRRAKSTAIGELIAASLITAELRTGKNPVVTMGEVE